jgi:hypothetical protein
MFLKKSFILFLIFVMGLAGCTAASATLVSPTTSPTKPPTTTPFPPAKTPAPAATTGAADHTSPTEQPGGNPRLTGASCLVGTWEISGFEAFIATMLPKGAFEPGTLAYDRSSGSLRYSFSDNGVLSIHARSFATQFKVAVDPSPMLLKVLLDGTASAKYQTQADEIQVGEITKDNLGFSAALDGIPMLDSRSVSEFTPLFASKKATYQCSGDTLSLRVEGMPSTVSPITFQRVQP